MTKSSDGLVNASTKFVRPALPKIDDVATDGNMVRGITQELEAQEVVLRKRRELSEAEGRLSEVRRSRYDQFSTSS